MTAQKQQPPRDMGAVYNDALDARAADDMHVPAPWRQAFDTAIATDPRGRQGVSERLGVTRAYVSRVAGGDLTPRPPPRFIARVQAVLMQVDCPHLQRALPPAECQRFAARSYAQVSQFEVAHWRACRACPSNPNKAARVAVAASAAHGGQS
jgi:hypothetical protein